jgi:SAM-dependent methyltransferase
MAFLARAAATTSGVAQVVGNDGVLKSLETFAAENIDLEITLEEETTDSKTRRFVGNSILLVQGDFFELDERATDGRFEAIFDRASLVAINPSLRNEYVQVLSRLIKPGGRILLVVIERTGGDLEAGPPYSVSEAQVRALYEGKDWIESVTLLEDNGEETANVDRDMRSLFFLIQAK